LALDVIATVQVKLEKKGFENAKQYVIMRQYKAAIVSIDNFKKNFPDSKYQEEATYLAIMCQFELAEKSILSKQPERYKEVIENYKDFVDRYPESKFLKDAERYYTESNSKLVSLKKTNS
jgi:outer membrane protein assembly factor BamD